MLLGARIGTWSGEKLPYDEELEYIESNGNQYIELDIKYGSGGVVDIKKCMLCSVGDEIYFIGGRASGGGDTRVTYLAYYLGYFVSSYIEAVDFWSKYGEANTGVWYGVKTRLGSGLCTRYVKNISASGEYSLDGDYNAAGTCYVDYNMVIFGRRWGSTDVTRNGAWRTGEIVIKSDDETETICDLVPVLKNDVAYMYDKVSGKLFGCSVSGHTLGYCKKDGTVVSPT